MESTDVNETFDAWGLLEIMGHNRLAGRITNQAIGGCNFVRIDVPEINGAGAFTKLFGQSAIFGITITTEDVARRLAKNMQAQPIHPYELREPEQPKLPYRATDGGFNPDYDPDDHDGDADERLP